MRVCVNLDEESFVYRRLEELEKRTGMSKPSILLAALAEYQAGVEPPEQKRTHIRTPKKQKHLGEGGHPKDLNEVMTFFAQRGVPEPIRQKAVLFYDYYQSNGWKVGKNPCKNWGSCLTTWQGRHADWKPAADEGKKKPAVKLKDFLEWVRVERPSWYEKLREQSIEEIDGYYIQEYTQNIGRF